MSIPAGVEHTYRDGGAPHPLCQHVRAGRASSASTSWPERWPSSGSSPSEAEPADRDRLAAAAAELDIAFVGRPDALKVLIAGGGHRRSDAGPGPAPRGRRPASCSSAMRWATVAHRLPAQPRRRGRRRLSACLAPALYELFVRASGETMTGHDRSVVVDPQGNELTAMPHIGAPATGERPPTNIDRLHLPPDSPGRTGRHRPPRLRGRRRRSDRRRRSRSAARRRQHRDRRRARRRRRRRLGGPPAADAATCPSSRRRSGASACSAARR